MKLKCALMVLLTGAALAQEPSILNVSLHDSKSAVQAKLKVRATFQREEEGQQVWQVRDAEIKNLIVGFDAEDRVRYITALGTNVPCRALGLSPKSRGKAPDLVFQRSLDDVLVVGHGADAKHLTSCSLKNPKAQMPDEEEEKERQ